MKIGIAGEKRPASAGVITKAGEFTCLNAKVGYGEIGEITIMLDPETLARIVRVAITGQTDYGLEMQPKNSN